MPLVLDCLAQFVRKGVAHWAGVNKRWPRVLDAANNLTDDVRSSSSKTRVSNNFRALVAMFSGMSTIPDLFLGDG